MLRNEFHIILKIQAIINKTDPENMHKEGLIIKQKK